MRSVPFALVLVVLLVGCDAIYERPGLEERVDFGEPYTIRTTLGHSSPAGARDAPYITSDDRLVVDVTFRARCEANRFVLRAEPRDQETIDLWLVHQATPESCTGEDEVERRLVFDVPAYVAPYRRQVLLTPDRGPIVLERDLG